MKRPVLHRLAAAAGVIRHWTDAQGRPARLDDEVVRTLLQALQWPAANETACRESLRSLQRERHTVPPLITADAGGLFSPGVPGALPRHAAWRDSDGHARDLVAVDPRHWRAPVAPGYYRLELDDAQATLAVAPPRCFGVADACAESAPRCWGLAAQVYSLRRPGDGGVGDSGAVAELAARVGAAGGDALGLSPLHALCAGVHSPYSPSDRRFLNPTLADPAQVLGEPALRAAIQQAGLAAAWQQAETMALIDWPAAAAMRRRLRQALHAQSAQMPSARQRDLAAFREAGGAALLEHAAMAARQESMASQHRPVSWRQWAPGWRADVDAAAIDEQIFAQWLASRCWETTQRDARAAGLRLGLVTDLAVGFEPGGGEAWRHRHWLLDKLSLGAPPDAFNARGQQWGITGFSPCGLRRSGYQPFIEVLRATMRMGGGVRIDHALGLSRLWAVPAGADADAGGYIAYPLHDLLRLLALESWRHRCVVIGEDLGTVPADLRRTLAARGVLGTDVLLFNRDERGRFLPPQEWRAQAMGTTTTHDLAPLAGWRKGHDIDWRTRAGMLSETERQAARAERREDVAQLDRALAAPEPTPATAGPDWAAVRFVARSNAALVLLPMEDALGLDEQPNLPGTVGQHPNWCRRMPPAEAAVPLEPVLRWIDRHRHEGHDHA
jgi:4-alpha-glucanotransferase